MIGSQKIWAKRENEEKCNNLGDSKVDPELGQQFLLNLFASDDFPNEASKRQTHHNGLNKREVVDIFFLFVVKLLLL